MAFPDDALSAMLLQLGTAGMSGTSPITGIFRAPNQNMTLFTGEVNSDLPTYLMKQGDITTFSLDIGAPITINGTNYTVSDSKAENSGFVRLSLTRE